MRWRCRSGQRLRARAGPGSGRHWKDGAFGAGYDLRWKWTPRRHPLCAAHWNDDNGKRLAPVDRLAEDLLELVQFFLEQLGCFRLEVEAEQGLGVGLADVEPPVAEVDGDAVEVVDLGLFVVLGQFADLGLLVLDLEVDLAGLAVA